MDTAAAHELLLRLAGRLPDDVSWRLRDWLAAGAAGPVGSLLPRALLRNRIGVTDHERELLAATSLSRLVDAVLPGVEPPAPSFAAGPEIPDLAVLTAMAVVAGRAEELRDARRGTQRVLVVTGADRAWELTGTLQRLLRVHGDRTPCVEVLPTDLEPPAYHQAAIVGSRPVWTAPARSGVPVPTN
ncbi:hypothetical protein [Pseudonocardia oroxyli]|uniref:Uncharacterized protein n=1 Tax=Pseudonocardia oroxyli TaxID=366584 RepID=A0A1G7T102_PSEOR|nr:hypothetical protein [Pseudonocardia oroxyli]SDG28888.1 hypothetical protein SAMN05216377_110163 [Pseudonocardia oroxyli]